MTMKRTIPKNHNATLFQLNELKRKKEGLKLIIKKEKQVKK